LWQWKYRRRSGVEIAKEAIYVNSLGVDNILFHADTFTLDDTLVNELCDHLIASDSPFRWACNTHVKNLLKKPDLVHKMKKAGCWMIAIGIESGSDVVLLNIKKQTTIEQIRSVVEMINAADIEAWGYFVLGLPGDSEGSLNSTIDFALSLPLKIAKFDIGTPYPGTEFYDWAKNKGYLRASEFEELDQNASAVVEYPDLSCAEIKAAVRKANRRFYLRPRILFRMLREALNPTLFKTLLLITRDQFLLLKGTRKNNG